jgi:hypothetical protein
MFNVQVGTLFLYTELSALNPNPRGWVIKRSTFFRKKKVHDALRKLFIKNINKNPRKISHQTFLLKGFY